MRSKFLPATPVIGICDLPTGALLALEPEDADAAAEDDIDLRPESYGERDGAELVEDANEFGGTELALTLVPLTGPVPTTTVPIVGLVMVQSL